MQETISIFDTLLEKKFDKTSDEAKSQDRSGQSSVGASSRSSSVHSQEGRATDTLQIEDMDTLAGHPHDSVRREREGDNNVFPRRSGSYGTLWSFNSTDVSGSNSPPRTISHGW
jgi:hypothetical protein